MRRLLLVAAIVGVSVIAGPAAAEHWHSQQSTVRTEALQYSSHAVPAVIVTTTSTTTTVAPTTTLPPVHKVIRALRAEPTSATTSVPTSGDVWDRLAACESGGNWADKDSPTYRGGIQFSYSTWRSVGGTGDPADASKAEQIMRGQMLQSRDGWSPWPACSHRLGLR